MKMKGRLSLVPIAMLAACASSGPKGPLATPQGPSSSVTLLQSSELPEPQRADIVAQARPYLIGPFDKLTIDVFGIPELTQREVQADAGGRISFPLAGVIEAAGKTPGEIEQEIEGRLRERYVRDPQVTVNLRENLSRLVTVDGQVKQPGLYPVVGKMTLMRAIATARGLDEFAKQDDVVVFRTVDEKRYAAIYNLGAIRRGNYDDPEIFANDVVIVGESTSRRLLRDAIGVIPSLLAPLIVTLSNNGN
jgi:polysaccharide export outer membrane protein